MIKDKIKVAIVGTGRISDLHAIEYIQNPDSKIVALCDSNIDLALSRAKKWGCNDSVQITDDLDKVLTNDKVDVVELLLPHHMHFPAALQSIKAGKIISLQKPICLNLDEANQLVEEVEKYDKLFKVFENFIFHPPVIKAKKLIDSGVIGTPLSIRIKSNFGIGDEAWNVPKYARTWRRETDKSGGGPAVFDDGHHKFALAWYFMGEPDRVHAFIGDTKDQHGDWMDAQSQISFHFPENRIGNLEIVYSPNLKISGKYYAQDDRVEITGTHGVLWINCGHGHIGDFAPVVVYRDNKVTEYRDMIIGWEQSFILSTRHFIKVIKEGGEPIITASQARDILKFSCAAEESAKQNKTIELKY
jgi:predicted dehydrogenase